MAVTKKVSGIANGQPISGLAAYDVYRRKGGLVYMKLNGVHHAQSKINRSNMGWFPVGTVEELDPDELVDPITSLEQIRDKDEWKPDASA